MNSYFFKLTLLSLMFTTVATSAQDKNPNDLQKSQLAKKYTYQSVPNDPTQARMYVLDNGLTVFLSVNKTEPRINVNVAVKAGSKNDPASHTGLAHYLEHMLFKGTDKFGTKDYAKEKPLLDKIEALYEAYGKSNDEQERKAIYHEIDSVSGVAATFAIPNEIDKMFANIGAKGTNAFTSFDKTVYVNDIPSNQLENFLTIEAERYRNPQIRIFHTELEAVYEEKNISLDNDGRKQTEVLLDALFRKHNYGQQTTIGTIEHLKRPSITEIKKYFYANYVPNNMAIIMTGDLDPDATIAAIDKAFAYMQPKPVAAYVFNDEDARNAPQFLDVYGPKAENVVAGWRFPAAGSTDANKAAMFIYMLYNGKAGLIDNNLNKKQLVLDAGAFQWQMADYSMFMLNAEPKEGQTMADCLALMQNEVAKIKRGEFDETMLKSVINNLKVSEVKRLESNGQRTAMIMNAFTNGVSWPAYVNRFEEMKKITKQDIIDFANNYITNDYVVVYKNKGEEPNKTKVDKPTITPITINRNDQSEFLKNVINNTPEALQPVFLDFKKDIKNIKTQNNDTLHYIKNTDNELFTVAYEFKIGSAHNKLLPIALSLLEYLPAGALTSEQASRELYNLAGEYNTQTQNDITRIQFSGADDQMENIMNWIENLMNNCKTDDKALSDLVNRMIKERDDLKTNKGYIQYLQKTYAAYGPDNINSYDLNTKELKALISKDLIELLHNLSSYPHHILYYGPRELSAVESTINKLHKSTTKKLIVPEEHKFVQLETNTKTVYVTYFDAVQVEIGWVRNDTKINNDDVPLTTLFNQYFGGNMSSLVFQTIRESKALAYSTNAQFQTPQRTGERYSMSAYVGTQADKMPEAIIAMNELLTELPYSEGSFNQAKSALRNKIESERIRGFAIFIYNRSAQLRNQNNDARQTVYQNLDALTFDSIKEFHKTHVAVKPYQYTVLGAMDKINFGELEKYGTIVELSIEELMGE